MAFFCLEFRIVAVAPSLAGQESQAVANQDSADGGETNGSGLGESAQVIFEFRQGPGCEAQTQTRGLGRGGFDDERLDVAVVDSRPTRAGSVVQARQATRLKSLHPFVGVAVVQLSEIGALGNARSSSQLPNQTASPVQSGRGRGCSKDSLQFQQFLCAKRRKEKGTIHSASSYTAFVEGSKRNIALFMARPTRSMPSIHTDLLIGPRSCFLTVVALKRLQTGAAAELDALLPRILDRAFKGDLQQ